MRPIPRTEKSITAKFLTRTYNSHGMIRRQKPVRSSVGARTCLGVLLVFLCLTSCKRGQDPLAHGWEKDDGEPLAGALILEQAGSSECVWRVDEVQHTITISRVPKYGHSHPEEVRIQTPNGTLIGEDHGEWGGSLSVLNVSSEVPKRLLDKNVRQIIPVKSGFAVITGNLSFNEGTVWLYSKGNAGIWSIEKKADLNGYPKAIRNGGSGILLVRGDGVDLVDADFKVRRLAELPLLEVHPNSVAEDARGSIYIGMDAFVVRLVPNQTGYEHEWFAGKKCLH